MIAKCWCIKVHKVRYSLSGKKRTNHISSIKYIHILKVELRFLFFNPLNII